MNKKKVLIISCIGVVVLIGIVVALLMIFMPKDGFPEDGDCVWSVWSTDEVGEFGKKTTFTRECLDCKKVQEYSVEPCKHLKYEDDSNGGVSVMGVNSGCNCEFMYILSKSPDGKSVSTIGDSAFIDNEFIKHLYVESGVKTVDVAAFTACTALKSANLPDSITYMEAQAFFSCEALYVVHVPKGITKITEYMFGYCSSLREIEIHEGITALDMGSYTGCVSLTEVNLPQSVETLGKNAFYGCSNLEKISMPGVKGELLFETFGSCTSLKEFVVPDGVVGIMSGAFFNCTGLEKFYIHKNVEILEVVEGESPFIMCDYQKLKVYCEIESVPEGWLDGYDVCNHIEYENGETKPVRAEFIYGYDF